MKVFSNRRYSNVRRLTVLGVGAVGLLVGANGFTQEHVADVGIAAVDIEPAIGIPLAGYSSKLRRIDGFIDWTNKYPESRYFKPSTGRHSAIRSKSMVIRSGDRLLVFVSVDLVGVEAAMFRDLAKRLKSLGVTEDNLIVSGTHTHSGPGTVSRRFGLQIVAVDAFRRKNYNSILDKMQMSVEIAFARLASADLLTSSFETSGIQRNKFRKNGEGHYDNTAKFLLARARVNGQLLGGIVNYALHGNGMPVDDMRFSSDVLGQIEINLERVIAENNKANHYKPVILFMNGAEGDVGNPVRTEEAVVSDGIRFAEQAVEAGFIESLRAINPVISLRRSKVRLGIPTYSPKNCAEDKKSFIARRGLGLKIPLLFLYPQSTYITVAAVGDILMLTWPGEASTQVGFDLHDAVHGLGYENSWFLGLANDYMAYFTTQEEYTEGKYDSCSSLFGWKGAEKIRARYLEMLANDS